MPQTSESRELSGLTVRIDRLLYKQADPLRSGGRRHAFVYYLSILNHSDTSVLLLGRKWVLQHEDGERLVIEGDKIVGETPLLEPGGAFSYNSFHLTNGSAIASGSFHGVDAAGRHVHVRIPSFHMIPPADSGEA